MKPMLAGKYDDSKAKFPGYASPKLDGIRCLGTEFGPVGRSLKKIPNEYIQLCFEDHKQIINGLDGELCVGPPTSPDLMQATTSGVMSFEGAPDFTYYVFDIWSLEDYIYAERYEMLMKFRHELPFWCKVLPQIIINNQDELDGYEAVCLEQGYEGVMYRSLDGDYKFGRSTVKEGFLLKVKRFETTEYEIIGYEELFHNDNEPLVNELGNSKRPSNKEGMRAGGVLGAIVLKDPVSGLTFNCGSGYTAEMRSTLWNFKEELVGKIATVKHFANAGVKDRPRFPVFVAIRHPDDISE